LADTLKENHRLHKVKSPKTMEPSAPPAAPTALDRLRGGLPHRSTDPALIMLRQKARALVREFNATPEAQMTARLRTLASLFGALGTNPEIDAPFFCEYGQNTHLGDSFTAGPGCVLMDVGKITIGNRVRFGPGVHVYAAVHPYNAAQRAEGLTQAAPVTIGDDVWIGGRSVVCATVSIGAGTIVAPGSVVVESLPAGVLAAGNPCRIVREL